MSEKPIVLFICGAWHVPESYAKLKTALESQGFEVHIPRLLSMNESRPPNANFTDDCQLVRSYAESLVSAGRTVIAMGHSWGAHVMSNSVYGLGLEARAAEGKKGGVSHLIYMAGYALPEGLCTWDKFKEFGDLSQVPINFDKAEDGTVVLRDPKHLFLTGKEDEVEVEVYLKSLVRFNGASMFIPSQHAAWRDIPVSYIHTKNDLACPEVEQEDMVQGLEKAGRKVQRFTVNSAHAPNFTAPQEVAEVVSKVASG